LVANGHDVAVIEYHSGDSYENTASLARISYYGITGFPHTKFDGVESVSGGLPSGSMYSNFLPPYNLRIAIPCDFTTTIYGQNTGGLDYTVTMVIDLENGTPPSDLKAHLVLTESHIPESWGGLTEVNYVCRAMYPSHNGTDVDFAGGNQVIIEYNFTLDPSWVQSNIELVAFVQSNGSREVLQGTMVPIDDLIPNSASAGFGCSDNQVCDGSSVDFYDESLGDLVSWEWTFEGGTPATSTEQNPTVVYNTVGDWDVELTVFDGTDYSTLTREDYISVISTPPQAGTPAGSTELCGGESGIVYTTSGANWALDYTWSIDPASAGTIFGTTTTATLNLDPAFSGPVNISVRGNGECGEGIWSEDLTVDVFPLPAVFWISDGSSFCEGGDGVEVTLDGSETGVDYELLLDGVPTGDVVPGTGSSISFGYQQGPGIYTIEGVTAYCNTVMNGTAYIHAIDVPGQAATPYGAIATCIGGTDDYSTTGAPDAETYVWMLDPPEAGEITGTEVIATVDWSDTYSGPATVTVQGINDCGDGTVSDPLDVVVESLPEPEVTGDEYVYANTDHYYTSQENAGATYEWSVTGGTITSGQGTHEVLVTWGNPGSGTVNLTETSGAGCVGEAVEFIVNISPVGIDEAFMNDINLYPNPAGEKLNIEFYSEKATSVQFLVINQTGQIMIELSRDISSGNNKTAVNTSELTNGYYTLKMIAEDGTSVRQRFIIMN